MKKIIINIVILILSLCFLGLIIYLGQFFTKLRTQNQVLLNSLDTSYQNSLGELETNLSFIPNPSVDNPRGILQILSKFSKDLKLRDTLYSLVHNYQIINQGELCVSIINNKPGALNPLVNLLKDLKFLESYHLNFVSQLEYRLQNWLVFLGYQQPTHYLLVFQDTDIPRPSGGFLGAYALLSFNQGQMDIKANSIFDLDDLLLDKIVPPYPLQAISNKWFFHDANWFFDFPQTSKKLLDFYQKTGLTPSLDGVIAVNSSVISSLLELTGPVQLPDYGLTIEASNFNSFFNQQILNSSQSISRQGRDIFTEFLSSLFKQGQTLSSSQLMSFQKLLTDAFSTKDLQIYSSNDAVEYYFDSLNWSGKILESPNDYLAVTFNDLNKNFLLDKRQKSIQLETNITSSTVTDILTVKSQFLNYQDKTLETYLKIYLPQGVSIINASGGYLAKISGSWPYDKLNYQIDPDLNSIESKCIKDETKGIEICEEGQKTMVSTWAKLAEEPLVLTYQFPLSKNNLNNWSIQVQKQSGQKVMFNYHIFLPPDKQLSPTLFSFQKAIPLTQDSFLNFDINSL